MYIVGFRPSPSVAAADLKSASSPSRELGEIASLQRLVAHGDRRTGRRRRRSRSPSGRRARCSVMPSSTPAACSGFASSRSRSGRRAPRAWGSPRASPPGPSTSRRARRRSSAAESPVTKTAPSPIQSRRSSLDVEARLRADEAEDRLRRADRRAAPQPRADLADPSASQASRSARENRGVGRVAEIGAADAREIRAQRPRRRRGTSPRRRRQASPSERRSPASPHPACGGSRRRRPRSARGREVAAADAVLAARRGPAPP